MRHTYGAAPTVMIHTVQVVYMHIDVVVLYGVPGERMPENCWLVELLGLQWHNKMWGVLLDCMNDHLFSLNENNRKEGQRITEYETWQSIVFLTWAFMALSLSFLLECEWTYKQSSASYRVLTTLDNQSVIHISIAPISSAKPGSVAWQPNRSSAAKSMIQFRNFNHPSGVLVSMGGRPSQRDVFSDVSWR